MDEILPDVLPIIDNIIDQPIFIPPWIFEEDGDLGVVSDPKSFPGYVSESDPTDVFAFSLDSTQNLNLALTKITAGDDADIYLYKDVDGNGLLDKSIDLEIASSLRSSNLDEAINLQGQAPGTYLAEVVRYAPTSVGSVRYNLSLSATPNGPTTSPSNLLPTEVNVGNLSNTQTFYNDSVGNTDTADVYRFSLNPATYGYRFSLDLTGLSNDADVRLIKDFNSNGIVDAGDELTRSQAGGSASESIRYEPLYSGDYFVQVYQYSGDTSYQLDMSAVARIG